MPNESDPIQKFIQGQDLPNLADCEITHILFIDHEAGEFDVWSAEDVQHDSGVPE